MLRNRLDDEHFSQIELVFSDDVRFSWIKFMFFIFGVLLEFIAAVYCFVQIKDSRSRNLETSEQSKVIDSVIYLF